MTFERIRKSAMHKEILLSPEKKRFIFFMRVNFLIANIIPIHYTIKRGGKQ